MSAGEEKGTAHVDASIGLASTMLEEHTRWAQERACPVRAMLSRLGDTWTLRVLLQLGDGGALRFRELLRAVDGISQRMLTTTLRELERDGLVARRVFDTKPPSVEYRLTELGASLLTPVRGVAEWALAHDEEMAAARRAFDARHRSHAQSI